jgi:hypothetical protein
MMTAIMNFASKGCAASLFLAAALLSAQQRTFDGTWQMDTAKSHVSDGRVVTLMIATIDDGFKMTIKTRKSDGQETTSEFSGKFNGKAFEFAEGTHKSQLTVWYNGPTLNACKENGPVGDVTSVWKFELAPDKQSMTMKITHYEPAADDETLVFTKKAS